MRKRSRERGAGLIIPYKFNVSIKKIMKKEQGAWSRTIPFDINSIIQTKNCEKGAGSREQDYVIRYKFNYSNKK